MGKVSPIFVNNPKTKDDNGSSDHSSEENRKDRGNKPPPKQKSKKMEAVKIDKQITLKISKDELPDDAVFKGYETRVFQDIKPILYVGNWQ